MGASALTAMPAPLVADPATASRATVRPASPAGAAVPLARLEPRDWRRDFVTNLGAPEPGNPNASLRLTLPAAQTCLPPLGRLVR